MRTITLTVDVEPDASEGSWSTSNPISFNGVFDGISKIESVTSPLGVPVTYFLQPVVLYNDDCVKYLKTISGEMGSHLHGEYIDPNAKYAGPDYSGCDPGEKQSDYPLHIEMEKMRNLTTLFRQQMGYNPVSFRAGRFGVSKHTFSCLSSLGYTHDSSVVPGHKNSRSVRKLFPYTVCGITEVPITVMGKKWLRPTPGYSNLKEMKKLLVCFRKHQSNVCCMFHNVEVVPGINPYCQSKTVCSDMLKRLFDMLEYALSIGYTPITVSEARV